jgi:hypothetical protein
VQQGACVGRAESAPGIRRVCRVYGVRAGHTLSVLGAPRGASGVRGGARTEDKERQGLGDCIGEYEGQDGASRTRRSLAHGGAPGRKAKRARNQGERRGKNRSVVNLPLSQQVAAFCVWFLLAPAHLALLKQPSPPFPYSAGRSHQKGRFATRGGEAGYSPRCGEDSAEAAVANPSVGCLK